MSKFYRKGRVEPANLKHLKQLSRDRHFTTLSNLPVATESTWDSRKHGWVGAIKDQGDCGCHDDKTEVLTENGWQKWENYDWKTSIGTINPITKLLEFQQPTEQHIYDYDGPLYYTNHKFLDFALTPNHRMFVRKWNESRITLEDNFKFTEISKIDWFFDLPYVNSELNFDIITLDGKKDLYTKNYHGKVYCATVPNGIIITRRNEYTLVSGNSCWDFSGTGVCEIANNVAGVGGGPTKMILSEEYTLSCGQNGGCNGDDNTTVLDWAKTTGLPLTADYGPYDGQADQCNYTSGMKLWKINDWGFADTNNENSVGDTQAIKNAIKAYGCVGAGISADDAFENNPAGTVFQDSGSEDINHDIILIGWDDSKGAWLLRNSWGTEWCSEGYCWIAYGANGVGTEAVFAKVTNPNPPTPTPTPGPTPSPTPTPVPPNVIETDMNKLFADIESRFSDQPSVLIGLEVMKYVLNAYLNSLNS